MAKQYKVMVWINVMGKNSQAEGNLEITLPFVPEVNLEIADLHVGEHLCVESVSWSHQARKFAVWMAGITDPTRKLSGLLSKFVGEWEWEPGPLPKELTEDDLAGEEPAEGNPKQGRPALGDDAYQKAVLHLLKGRGKAIPKNPSEKAENPPLNPEAN